MTRSRHAQESRTVKIAKSPKMAVFHDNAPLLTLTGIAFGGSCQNIYNFFGACGITGVIQVGETGCPDLLCYVAMREIIRDRRHRRHRKYGVVTWPVVVLLIGIAETLALNYIGADAGSLTSPALHVFRHVAALLALTTLLLALSLRHRRDAGTAEASGTKSERRRMSASTGTPEPKAAAPVPVSAPEPVPAKAPAGEGQPQPWTDEDLVEEARRQWAEHAAMGVRLSQARFEMALKQSPRGGAGRPRVIEALKVVRAEMDGADDEAAAVGQ